MFKKGLMIAVSCFALGVVPASALETEELLALVALPLVVDQVAEMADVPEAQLGLALAALAGADLRPTRTIEVVSHMPVALVYDQRTGQTDFVRFVTLQREQGLRGDPFYDVVTNHLVDTYGIPSFVFVDPAPMTLVDRRFFLDEGFISPTVTTVVREIRTAPVTTVAIIRDRDWSNRGWSSHPHGGPPGLVKRSLGAQTGAEVVLGSDGPERTARQDRDVIVRDRDRDGRIDRRDAGRDDDRKRGEGKSNKGKSNKTKSMKSDRDDDRPEQSARNNRGENRSQGKANRSGQGREKKGKGRNLSAMSL